MCDVIMVPANRPTTRRLSVQEPRFGKDEIEDDNIHGVSYDELHDGRRHR